VPADRFWGQTPPSAGRAGHCPGRTRTLAHSTRGALKMPLTTSWRCARASRLACGTWQPRTDAVPELHCRKNLHIAWNRRGTRFCGPYSGRISICG